MGRESAKHKLGSIKMDFFPYRSFWMDVAGHPPEEVCSLFRHFLHQTELTCEYCGTRLPGPLSFCGCCGHSNPGKFQFKGTVSENGFCVQLVQRHYSMTDRMLHKQHDHLKMRGRFEAIPGGTRISGQMFTWSAVFGLGFGIMFWCWCLCAVGPGAFFLIPGLIGGYCFGTSQFVEDAKTAAEILRCFVLRLNQGCFKVE